MHPTRTVRLLLSEQTMGKRLYLHQFLEWHPLKRCSFAKLRDPREHSIPGSRFDFLRSYNRYHQKITFLG